jgi:hypothetical protein
MMTTENITQPSVVLETITPDRARDLLKRNTSNFRKPDAKRVNRFAEEMRNGRWSLSGDTIKMSDHVLLDGQHRLLACIASGASFQTFVAYGISANPATLDRGKPRTVGQYFAHEGMNNANNLAAVCRNVVCHDRGYWASPSFSVDFYTDSALIDYAIAHQAGLQSAIQLAGWAVKSSKIMPISLAATLIHIGCGRSNYPAENDLVSWFWEGIKTGIEMKEYDPPLVLRNRLIDNRDLKHKIDAAYMRHIATIAWNRAVVGQPLKVLRLITVGPNAQTPPSRIFQAEVAQ